MSPKNEDALKALAIKLFEINALKFGDFKMKVGINTPVYFDLRVIVSYPEIMNKLCKLIVEFIKENNINCDHVCGVPYTALPIATIVSIDTATPMLIRRKEAKNYGTKKMIEGKYNAGDNCLIIEDVVTSGSSVLDTVKDLRTEGIKVTDAIVVVDREQGGIKNIEKQSVRMHSLFTLSRLLSILKDAGKIEETTVQAVAKFIKDCQILADGSVVADKKEIDNGLVRTRMTFKARAELTKCQLAKDIFHLMMNKNTNLCLAADVTKCEDILNLAESCGPYICILKTHCDIIDDFSENFIQSLSAIAKKHNFLIMEDRKFADIGNTVTQQYSTGIFKISNWADLVTVHSIPGPSIIQGLKSNLDQSKNRGCFLLAEMSSKGNLINEKYKESTIKMSTEGSDIDFIAGIVCQNSECFTFPGLIQLTPGVKIDDVSDNLGQQYQTPEYIVKEKGADIGVVGRGIIKAKSIEKAAALYRDRLWAAYCDRVQEN